MRGRKLLNIERAAILRREGRLDERHERVQPLKAVNHLVAVLPLGEEDRRDGIAIKN